MQSLHPLSKSLNSPPNSTQITNYTHSSATTLQPRHALRPAGDLHNSHSARSSSESTIHGWFQTPQCAPHEWKGCTRKPCAAILVYFTSARRRELACKGSAPQTKIGGVSCCSLCPNRIPQWQAEVCLRRMLSKWLADFGTVGKADDSF